MYGNTLSQKQHKMIAFFVGKSLSEKQLTQQDRRSATGQRGMISDDPAVVSHRWRQATGFS
jgi:hypothetical protein